MNTDPCPHAGYTIESCPHAGFTTENAERLMADELLREQNYLKNTRREADELLDVLYNDHVLGKYIMKRQKQEDIFCAPELRLPRNDHNELGCVVNICKNILFAAPPEGADADLTEAELQREEIIRHHRLLYALRKLHPIVFDDQVNPHTRHVLEQFHKDLTDELCRSHNAGISFPDPDLLRRRRKPEMDSDAEELLTEFATMKKKKLTELRGQLTKKIKDEIGSSAVSPLSDAPAPAAVATQPAGGLASALTSALQSLPQTPAAAGTPADLTGEQATAGRERRLTDPAVLAAMMSIDPSLALQVANASEHAQKREEKKRKRKKEKKEEQERRLSGSTMLAPDSPVMPEPTPQATAKPLPATVSTSSHNTTGAPSFSKSLGQKLATAKVVAAQTAPPTQPQITPPPDSPKHAPSPTQVDLKKTDPKKTDPKKPSGGEPVKNTGKVEFPKLKKREDNADTNKAKTADLPTSNGEKKTSGGGLVRRMAKIAATKKDSDEQIKADKAQKGESPAHKGEASTNHGKKTDKQVGFAADTKHKKSDEKADDGEKKKPSSGHHKDKSASPKEKPKIAKKEAAKAGVKALSNEPKSDHPSDVPGRKTIQPGEPRQVVLKGKEKPVGQVAEESKKAAKVAALRTSLKLLPVKDLIKSGQVTGSKPPSTFAVPLKE